MKKYNFCFLCFGRKIFYLYILLFCFLVFLLSCRTQKNVAVQTVPLSAAETALMNSILRSQPNFKTANFAKLNIEISLDGSEKNSPAVMKIYRDSIIQIFVQPFMGIEIFRLELTPQAMYLFDKMHTDCYAMTYEMLSEILETPLTFSNLQALLTNALFCAGTNDKQDFDKIKIQNTINTKTNAFLYQTEKINQTTYFNGQHIEKVLIDRKTDDYKFSADYAKFETAGGISFPMQISFNFKQGRREARLSFSILRAEFNKVMKMTPTNPQRYTPRSIDGVLKSLEF